MHLICSSKSLIDRLTFFTHSYLDFLPLSMPSIVKKPRPLHPLCFPSSNSQFIRASSTAPSPIGPIPGSVELHHPLQTNLQYIQKWNDNIDMKWKLWFSFRCKLLTPAYPARTRKKLICLSQFNLCFDFHLFHQWQYHIWSIAALALKFW
jgi:hypothetical protein